MEYLSRAIPSPCPTSPGDELEHYRPYLTALAEMQMGRLLRKRLDASDVVQQTLLKAHANAGQLRGGTAAEVAAWLRQILAHTLADAARANGNGKRDVARERSLEQQLEASSVLLGAELADDGPSPSQHAREHERAVRLAEALARLPEAQRRAITLQYWHGLSLAEIGEELGRTEAAVAGLLHRGLKALRGLLGEGA